MMLKRPTNVLVIIVVLWNYNQFKKHFFNTLYKTDTINNGEYSYYLELEESLLFQA